LKFWRKCKNLLSYQAKKGKTLSHYTSKKRQNTFSALEQKYGKNLLSSRAKKMQKPSQLLSKNSEKKN